MILLYNSGWPRTYNPSTLASITGMHHHTGLKNNFLKDIDKKMCLALVAHTCNPSYSGSRDQVDCGSKPAHANISQDPGGSWFEASPGKIVHKTQS
jgi:hypothetical protein